MQVRVRMVWVSSPLRSWHVEEGYSSQCLQAQQACGPLFPLPSNRSETEASCKMTSLLMAGAVATFRGLCEGPQLGSRSLRSLIPDQAGDGAHPGQEAGAPGPRWGS